MANRDDLCMYWLYVVESRINYSPSEVLLATSHFKEAVRAFRGYAYGDEVALGVWRAGKKHGEWVRSRHYKGRAKWWAT